MTVEFSREAETPPDWLDYSAFAPAVPMFYKNSQVILAAFVVGVLIEGFTTNIAQSFFITGRVRDQGIRRLGQNDRHMMEIFLPGGLYRYGDGWKLSVRIRTVHARLRYLLSNSEEWKTKELGVPISAAHLGYAVSVFSARLLKHMITLGAEYNEEEYESFLAVWRYSGHLMGIPETILFQDADEALKLWRIGLICEPESQNWINRDGTLFDQLSSIDCRDYYAINPPSVSSVCLPSSPWSYREKSSRVTDVSTILLLRSCQLVQDATAVWPHPG